MDVDAVKRLLEQAVQATDAERADAARTDAERADAERTDAERSGVAAGPADE
jgi:hypothetical protein